MTMKGQGQASRIGVFAVPVLLQSANLLWVPTPWRLVGSNLLQFVAAALFLAASWRTWRRMVAESRTKEGSGWFWVTLAAALWTAGMAGFMYIEVVEGRPAYPAWPDAFFLGFYPFFAVGLWRLAVGVHMPVRRTAPVLLDIVLLGTVAALVLWEFDVHRLFREFVEAPGTATRFSMAYATADFVLLMVVAGLFLTGGGGLPAASLASILAGFVALFVSDIAQGVVATGGAFLSGGWPDLGWTLFGSLFGLAADEAARPRQVPKVSSERVSSTAGFVLTYVWLGAVVFLLVRAVWMGPQCGSPAVLVGGAMVTLALVALRQSLTVAENLRLAESLRVSNESLKEEAARLEESNYELGESRERLREEAAFKDRLLAVVGHDLKNPLQAMMFSVDLLRQSGEKGGEEVREVAETLHVSVARMAEILDNLLFWGRARSGRLAVRPETVEVRRMVEDALDLFRPRVTAKRFQVVDDVSEDLRVRADRQMVSVVFRNLVSNAVKFTPEGGRIRVSAVREGEWVEVAVEDSGPGMSEEDRRRVFDVSVPREAIGDGEGKGTGLGLLLCKDFMERQGGEIRIESGSEGGCRVVVRFPAGG